MSLAKSILHSYLNKRGNIVFYHASTEHANHRLEFKIPDVAPNENNSIPRVSVCINIDDCLRLIPADKCYPGIELFVHGVNAPVACRYKILSTDELHKLNYIPQNEFGEYWILSKEKYQKYLPTIHLGKVRVLYAIPYSIYNKRNAGSPNYKWEWV